MFLALFDHEQRRVVHGKRGRDSTFRHSFGGVIDYVGLQPDSRQPPIHLLFRLNTDDPLVPIDLGRHIRWLPLLCAIRYGACALGYRVLSDKEVAILHQGDKNAWDNFPHDSYPDVLATESVNLVNHEYDPSNPGDAYFYGGILGYKYLSAQQMARVEQYVVAEGLCDMETEDPSTHIQTACWPYLQGPPVEDCPDPACSNHGADSALRTFAIFYESENRVEKLWGPNCDNLQIIYQICPRCKAISTTNQCT